MAININAKTSGVGGLETTADNSGNINIQSGGSTVMSVTSSGVAVTGSFSQNGAVYSTQPTFRNLIINGDMRIDQRNAGSAITAGGFMVDRWQNFQSQSSKWTSIQQVTDAPANYTNSVKYTSASSYTVGAADYFTHEQIIEGNIAAHLGWGASGAKTVTLSFYVKSSLTGTFGGALYAGSGSYGYPFEYTIDAANTWEKKTITIEGPTSGTFNTDNSASFTVCFGLGIGTDYSWTAGSWQAQVVRSATGATSVVGTNAATWQVTGVQLEVGSTATDFENLPYDVQLQRCMRYYEKSYNEGVAPASVTYDGMIVSAGNAGTATTGEIIHSLEYKVDKRATPTLSIYDSQGNIGKCTRLNSGVGNYDNSAVATTLITPKNSFIYSNTGTNAGMIRYHYVASAEL